MRTCKKCGNQLTRQKVYCSRACQGNGTVKKIEKKVCKNCKLEFDVQVSQRKNWKYCTRKCKDEYLKIKFAGEGNPSYGREQSQETKEKRAKSVRSAFQKNEIKQKHREARRKFIEKNGFHPGSDEQSIMKRKETNLKKYGCECTFAVKSCREKGCITTFERYGKTSQEIARKSLKHKNTSIEKKLEDIFLRHAILYERQHILKYFDEDGKSKFVVYDFFIPVKNLLIEADGDYWHCNPQKFDVTKMSVIQKRNVKNDKLKNKLAVDNNYNIVRYWESSILLKEFENTIIKEILNEQETKN